MRSNIINGMLLAALVAAASPESLLAQTDLPAAQVGLVAFGSQDIKLSDSEATQMVIPTQARYDYAVSQAEWLKPSVEKGQLVLNADANPYSGSRTAKLSVRSSQGVTTTLTVTQPGLNFGELAESALEAYRVRPTKATGTKAQSGYGAELTIDDNTSTMYHSNWSGYTAGGSDCPSLFYTFDKTDIGAFTYVPRQDGSVNGNFGNVRIYIRNSEMSSYTDDYSFDYDFGQSSSTTTVEIPEKFQKDIVSIKMTIFDGAADNGSCYASCAEMKFYKPGAPIGTTYGSDYDVFADHVLTGLKSGVTQADIDKMSDPFLKTLAQRMLNGTYSSAGRVNTYIAEDDIYELATSWHCEGKTYDKQPGATGIYVSPGKYVIMVEGIPESLGSIQLRLVGWSDPDFVKGSTDADGNEIKSYAERHYLTVQNGLNVISIDDSWRPGLLYVCNFNTEGAHNNTGDVTVHVVAGAVNGYISNTMTNEQIATVLDNAVYDCMDVVGQKVHSVWETAALKQYSSGQWVRYINALDLLIIWEHRILGFYKYDRVPRNKTLAFVNYDYYMYQGGEGVAFKYDTQSRTCSADNIINNDEDVVWGLSHEWGHQHQMFPYFRWGGLGEVSNNMNSLYNIHHMGYGDRLKGGMTDARTLFVEGKYDAWQTEEPDNVTYEYNGSQIPMHAFTGKRRLAIANAKGVEEHNNAGDWVQGAWDWCPSIKSWLATQSYEIPGIEDVDRAVSIHEADVNTTLVPFWMLHCYFSEPQTTDIRPDSDDYIPDYTPDLYEALRQTDYAGTGSTIEKSYGWDKYEMIAAAQDYNSNGAYEALVAAYPSSCWVTNKYITANNNPYQNTVPFILNFVRKSSLLSGYNLFPFFEKMGFLRTIGMQIGDYGNYHYALTPEMKAEFKTDMQALNLKECTDDMLNRIINCALPKYDRPNVPNDRIVTADDF